MLSMREGTAEKGRSKRGLEAVRVTSERMSRALVLDASVNGWHSNRLR